MRVKGAARVEQQHKRQLKMLNCDAFTFASVDEYKPKTEREDGEEAEIGCRNAFE